MPDRNPTVTNAKRYVYFLWLFLLPIGEKRKIFVFWYTVLKKTNFYSLPENKTEYFTKIHS
jgi:hypothetical protein